MNHCLWIQYEDIASHREDILLFCCFLLASDLDPDVVTCDSRLNERTERVCVSVTVCGTAIKPDRKRSKFTPLFNFSSYIHTQLHTKLCCSKLFIVQFTCTLLLLSNTSLHVYSLHAVTCWNECQNMHKLLFRI